MNIEFKTLFKFQWLIFLVTSVVFAYIVYRAGTLSLVHDEAFTFANYAKNATLEDVILYRIPIANNHLLNSILINAVIKLPFSTSELLIRLPNVLMFPVYAFSIYKTLKILFKDKFVITTLFCFFIFNPFLLDYFSLARGYGLGVGLMTLSIYLLLKFFKSKTIPNKYAYFAIFIGALSFHSNLVFLNYYLSLFGVISLVIVGQFINKKALNKKTVLNLVKNIAITSVLATVLSLPSIPGIKALNSNNSFYYGGQSFVDGTISSLVESSLYIENPNTVVVDLIKYLALAILIIYPISLGLIMYSKRSLDKNTQSSLIIGSLFYICAASTIAQKLLLENKYLIYRTGIFFIILFYFVILGLIYLLKDKSKQKFAKYFITSALLVIATVNIALTANLNYSRDWKYDSNTKEMMNDLLQIQEEEKISKVTLIVNWVFLPSVTNYINEKNVSDKIEMLHLEITDLAEEKDYFLYITPKYAAEHFALIPDLSTLGNYRIVKEYQNTDNILIEVNNN